MGQVLRVPIEQLPLLKKVLADLNKHPFTGKRFLGKACKDCAHFKRGQCALVSINCLNSGTKPYFLDPAEVVKNPRL